MKVPFIFISLCLLMIACKPKSNQPARKHSSLTLLQRLQQHKTDIDQRLAKDSADLTVYVKLTNKDELVKVEKNDWPDSVDFTLNVITDKSSSLHRCPLAKAAIGIFPTGIILIRMDVLSF